MGTVLLVLQLIVAIFLVAVILLQRSNGGALSGLGGDSGIGGLLSARGKGNILTRTTAVLATLFFALSMAISIYFSRVEVKRTSIVDAAAENTIPAEQNADVNTLDAQNTPDAEENTVSTPIENTPVSAEVAPESNNESVEAIAGESMESEAQQQEQDEPEVPVAE
ncbi:MAG: preprotein translocase subunit SecG [Alphaproteobacteria bacterium]|nr:preprotein translocase subunit SecG [Alphaproteobacteria bacterium]